jgi:spermidine synthase
LPEKPFDKKAKYVNDAILRTCFELPEFLRTK